jgi:hypothetical protein
MFRFVKGSLICCTMYLYIKRFMLLSNRCNRPYFLREKHSQTLIQPPPCFTVGKMYRTLIILPTVTRPSTYNVDPGRYPQNVEFAFAGTFELEVFNAIYQTKSNAIFLTPMLPYVFTFPHFQLHSNGL